MKTFKGFPVGVVLVTVVVCAMALIDARSVFGHLLTGETRFHYDLYDWLLVAQPATLLATGVLLLMRRRTARWTLFLWIALNLMMAAILRSFGLDDLVFYGAFAAYFLFSKQLRATLSPARAS